LKIWKPSSISSTAPDVLSRAAGGLVPPPSLFAAMAVTSNGVTPSAFSLELQRALHARHPVSFEQSKISELSKSKLEPSSQN
jgi:hypothetical protein